MKNITYIFSGNRKENYLENKIQAKDFYYGLTELDQEKFKIDVIEFEDKKNFLNYIFKFIDKIFSKFLSLPFYSSKICTIRNLRLLFKSDYIVLINEGVGFSTLPMLIIISFFKKNNVSLFVMGLYSKNINYKNATFIHFFFIRILNKYINNLFFLGEEEYKKAKKIHKTQHKKFHYLPFAIDLKFWKTSNNFDLKQNKNIIFVGNDGNRDFELLINIAKKLKQYQFIFVSSNQTIINTKLKNVKIFQGSWGSEQISDKDLKLIYQKAKLSILPLKNSFQPSGQSVALQSMSLGIPVIISITNGFWDKKIFKNNFNIFFVDNNINAWTKKIEELFEDNKLLDSVSENAYKTVLSNYSIEDFTKNFWSIVTTKF